MPSMYNRSYGGFDYPSTSLRAGSRIHPAGMALSNWSELRASMPNRKLNKS